MHAWPKWIKNKTENPISALRRQGNWQTWQSLITITKTNAKMLECENAKMLECENAKMLRILKC